MSPSQRVVMEDGYTVLYRGGYSKARRNFLSQVIMQENMSRKACAGAASASFWVIQGLLESQWPLCKLASQDHMLFPKKWPLSGANKISGMAKLSTTRSIGEQ